MSVAGRGDLAVRDLELVAAELPTGWVFLALPEQLPGAPALTLSRLTAEAQLVAGHGLLRYVWRHGGNPRTTSVHSSRRRTPDGEQIPPVAPVELPVVLRDEFYRELVAMLIGAEDVP